MWNTNQLAGFYIMTALALNAFMNNVEKWPNILLKPCGVPAPRFQNYVWPFFNIMHERVAKFIHILRQISNYII